VATTFVPGSKLYAKLGAPVGSLTRWAPSVGKANRWTFSADQGIHALASLKDLVFTGWEF